MDWQQKMLKMICLHIPDTNCKEVTTRISPSLQVRNRRSVCNQTYVITTRKNMT